MILHPFKASSLLLAAAVIASLALPTMAGDYHGGYAAFPHHGAHGMHVGNNSGFHRNFDFHRRSQVASGDSFRFGRHDFGRNRFDRDHYAGRAGFNGGRGGPGRIRRLASTPDTRGGSSVTVILRDRPDYDFISNYAGSNGVYRADGGTYVTGFGYSDGRRGRTSNLRPRAKIIDVAKMGDACSHEAGVCVIRP